MSLRRLLLLLAVVASTAGVCADFDPMDAPFAQNLAQPEVPSRATDAVRRAMQPLKNVLSGAGYTVSDVRGGTALCVTIAAGDLFDPNSTTLRDNAATRLRPLWPYIRRSDNYKVLIAVHSDDTGDETYSDRLTSTRAEAIDDFYYQLNNNTDTDIVPYGLGRDEPLGANNTLRGRERNRRVEIYFVPTQTFIDKARRNRDR